MRPRRRSFVVRHQKHTPREITSASFCGKRIQNGPTRAAPTQSGGKVDTAMVSTIEDRVLYQLAAKQTVSVPCGQMYTRKQQQAFELTAVNRDKLHHIIEDLVSQGLVRYEEKRYTLNWEEITDPKTRDRGSFHKVRVYELTPKGVNEQKRRQAALSLS